MDHVHGHLINRVTVGQGAPLAMIHCALASHETLLPLAGQIDGRIGLMDMPGHGRSDDWDGRANYHDLLCDALTGSCAPGTHVIGHSLGATVALRLAIERPELVGRLTLIEPVYFAAAKGTEAHQQHVDRFRPFIKAMQADDCLLYTSDAADE